MNCLKIRCKSHSVGEALLIAVIALAVTVSVNQAHAQPQYNALYNFTGMGEPAEPAGRVAQGQDGNLYGYSDSGGANNFGTIYQIATSGNTPVVLHNFPSYEDCGLGLTLGTDGKFYGSCQGGGDHGYGYVFQVIPPPGVVSFNKLYSFAGGTDGAHPTSRPIEAG